MVPRELNFVKKVGDFRQISGIKTIKIKGVVWAVKNVSSEVSDASIVVVELGVDIFANFEHKISSHGVDDILAVERFVVSSPSLNSPAKNKENEHDDPK